MKDKENKQEALRNPSQNRSKARVDSVLEAAKGLIREHGSSNLKMKEIAQRAGVTIGSIYQYFPNKEAIVEALARDYMSQLVPQISKAVATIDSVEQAKTVIETIMDEYYTVYKKEPVLQDIWIAIAADKNLNDLDINNSRVIGEVIMEAIQEYFPVDMQEDLRRTCFLFIHLTGPAVRAALSDPAQSDELFRIYKKVAVEYFLSLRDPKS